MANRRGSSEFTKVTGLFRSKKKKGLYLGSTDAERLDGLIEKIKEARKAKKQLTFFVWKSKYEDGPVFNLTVDVAQEQTGKSRSRPIVNDDADEVEETEEPEAEEADDEPEEAADPFD